jgi:hypothetical protein
MTWVVVAMLNRREAFTSMPSSAIPRAPGLEPIVQPRRRAYAKPPTSAISASKVIVIAMARLPVETAGAFR